MDEGLRSLLDKIGEMYVASLKSKIYSDGNNASGELLNSIKHKVNGDGVDFFWNDYLNAISEGKKSTSSNPSPEMVSRIASWMKYKKISIRGYRGRFQTKSASNYRRAAFGIARGINRATWSGSDVIDRAYRDIEKNIDSEFLSYFKKAIEDSIDKINERKKQ